MKTHEKTFSFSGWPGFLAVLLLTILIIILQGCSDKPTSPVDPAGSKAGAGTHGGNLKTILIPSASAYILPPPPGKNSSTAINEYNQIKEYQLKKTQSLINIIEYWDGLAIIRWNEITRHLVIKNGTNPPLASRAYALLSTAQYDALIAAWYNKDIYLRESPPGSSSEPCYPCEQAVIASVSRRVLSYLFPKDIDSINYWATQEISSQLYTGKNFPSDITAGDTLGAIISRVFINYAMQDGHDAVWTGTMPSFPGCWFSSMNPPQKPLLPMWGKVRPWLMTSLPPLAPPPIFGSDQFKAALAEVKNISDTRTDEQLRIAKFWSDGAGTATPPGHWNEIASNYIKTKNLSEFKTARALALMNMAIMDAGICCWDAKYTYWYIRPSQVDTTITTPVGLPNFPSYTSGHSSFSGAAHTVLGYLFPEKADEFKKMAEEAAISRLYGGIHYRFDSDMGLESGRAVGNLAVLRGLTDGFEGWNF
ncbi:MAG TPA: phosphatase PAP2 family protein [Ignavibacteriales bacterium]|nr:phosphatase PAP2 family protein [Ignavibacteriales bacterium]